MGWSLSMRSKHTSANTSQEELRRMMGLSPAVHRFQALFGTRLAPYVGKITEVFEPPKAEGVEFDFPKGMRTAFLNLVDPSTIGGRIGPYTFDLPAKGPMVPDDPGFGHPDRRWRMLASAASAGISYRQPGLSTSLHIAIREDGGNVHLDREGFVTSTDGRVTYDIKKVMNHLSADLLSDFAPGLVSSLTKKDGTGRTQAQATLAPWLEVNLPGTKDIRGARSDQTEAIIGVRLFGIFSAGGG